MMESTRSLRSKRAALLEISLNKQNEQVHADEIDGNDQGANKKVAKKRGSGEISKENIITDASVGIKTRRTSRSSTSSVQTTSETIDEIIAKAFPPTTVPQSQAPKDTLLEAPRLTKGNNISIIDLSKEYEAIEVPRVAFSYQGNPKCRDYTHCCDVLDRMYDNFYLYEKKYSADLYMQSQLDITTRMRSILIDWLVEVHNKFRLNPATLWLAVNILDRFLSKVSSERSKLQLIGVTSLLIACKYEEICPPDVKDCSYITDSAYSPKDIVAMEFNILTALNFEISVPTGYHFLVRYLNEIQATERIRMLAFYYAERNLQEYDMLLHKPHHFVAAAIYCAISQGVTNSENIIIRQQQVWTRRLEELTGLKEKDLLLPSRLVIRHVSEEQETTSRRKLIAAKKKYSSDRFHNVASLPLPLIL